MKRGDVLHVIESMHKIEGQVTSYLAWKVNLDGTEVEKGTVPNRTKYDASLENSIKTLLASNPGPWNFMKRKITTSSQLILISALLCNDVRNRIN